MKALHVNARSRKRQTAIGPTGVNGGIPLDGSARAQAGRRRTRSLWQGLLIAGWLAGLFGSTARADYVVNFEGPGETKTGYASGDVTLSGISWNLTEALIGTLANDWKNGARSARGQGYGTSALTMNADKSGGLGTLSFGYRRFGSDAQVAWVAEYSVNGGGTWTQIGSAFTPDATVRTFSQAVNVSGNVRIRIRTQSSSGTANRRANFDDITLTDYAVPGNDADSDIIRDASFTEPSNVAYADYQATDLTAANSIEVARFQIRDGGAGSDSDSAPTTLTGLTLSIANWQNLRRVGIYDGTTEIAEAAAAASVVFSGLSGLSAPDNGAKSFSIRVSYQATVTDKAQISFAIASATADPAGSTFAAADAGGAVSSTSGDRNRIQVTATHLAWASPPPANVGVNEDFAATVEARDANGNVDLDSTAAVTISKASGSGTLSSAGGLTGNLSAGARAWNDLRMDTAGLFTIQAAAAGLTTAVSDGIAACPLPAPVIEVASGVGANSFTAHWHAVPGAAGYRLDVSTSAFAAGGSESFENHNAGGSYGDGDYLGDGGIRWYYVHSRNDAGYPINGQSILMRRASDSSRVFSETLSGGIGRFSCKLRKGFTGTGNRQVELFINDVSYGASLTFGNFSGADATIHEFTVENINVSGDFTIRVDNISANQVVIDDIEWTSFGDTPAFVPGYEDRDVGNATQFDVTGLEPDTTYYYRVWAWNAACGTSANSATETATTSAIAGVPTVVTAEVEDIGPTSASGGGEVTSDGGAAVTERGVVLNLTGLPSTADTVFVMGSGTGPFSSFLTDLVPGQVYYARAYAINVHGTAYGAELSFAAACFPDGPAIGPPADLEDDRFTATWSALAGAQGYLLDVGLNDLFGMEAEQLAEDFSGFPSGDANVTASLDTYMQEPGWSGEAVFLATGGGMVKMGASSTRGILITPTLDLSGYDGAARVEFEARRWTGDATSLQIFHAADGATFVQVGDDIPLTDAMTAYTRDITGGTANSKIRFYARINSSHRYFLDNVRVVQHSPSFLPGYEGLAVAGTSQIVTGLEAGSTYYYRVRAAGAGDCISPYSDVQPAVTTGGVDAMPPTFSAFGVHTAGNLLLDELDYDEFILTVQIADAQSGLDWTVQPPSYTLRRPGGVIAASGTFDTDGDADGDTLSVAVKTIGGLPFASGTWTAEITARDLAGNLGETSFTFTMMDDDNEPPEVFEFTLDGVGMSGDGRLSSGGIAIIGVNGHPLTGDGGRDGESFAFVVLSPFPERTRIHFTDAGWANHAEIGWHRTSEFHRAYWDSTGAEAVGSVVTLSISNLNNGGDQVAVYQFDGAEHQDPKDHPELLRFLYAVNMGSAWSTPPVPNKNESSALYYGLTNGLTAVDLPAGGASRVNWRYIGPRTGTASDLLALISDRNNWIMDGANVDYTDYGGDFTVLGPGDVEWDVPVLTDAQVRQGNYVVEAGVHDLTKGLQAEGTDWAPPPHFLLLDADGGVVVSNDFTVAFASGDNTPQTLRLESVASGDYEAIGLGYYQAVIVISDADNDRPDDNLVARASMTVRIVDDDDEPPSALSSPPVLSGYTPGAWTTDDTFTLAWGAASDAGSGIGRYQIVAPVPDPSDPSKNDGTTVGADELEAHIHVAAQGDLTGYVFAVDADNDRPDDDLMGPASAFTVKIDRTPPTPVSLAEASTDTVDDPTSQFHLTWTTFGVGPDDPADPVHPTGLAVDTALLSPWSTYKIYYGVYDPEDRPEGMDGQQYVMKTFITSGEYRTFPFVDRTSAAEDSAAPADAYGALAHLATDQVRLYDLDYDLDYLVVVVGVDAAGNEGPATAESWATNNTIRFAVTKGWTLPKDDATQAFNGDVHLDNSATDRAVALEWIAAGATDETGQLVEVTRYYDMIYWDSPRFQERSDIPWERVGTVRSNWFVDDGGLSRQRGDVRFYRAAPKDRWRRDNGRLPMASEEVYALHNVVLSGGANFIGLHGIPYTNTFGAVFGGRDTFPGGVSIAQGATVVEFYQPGPHALASDRYWLDISGRWKHEASETDVTDAVQPDGFFTRGFSITLPNPLPEAYVSTNALDYGRLENGQPAVVEAMIWSPILQVPTNGFQQVIQTGSRSGRTSVKVYNLAVLQLPVAAHPGDMNLIESGFVRGAASIADHVYTMDTVTKSPRAGSTIYCDPDGIWRFVNGNGLVPAGFFKPNDVIVIVSQNHVGNGSWTWTYHPEQFYDLPTRWMAPAP